MASVSEVPEEATVLSETLCGPRRSQGRCEFRGLHLGDTSASHRARKGTTAQMLFI